MPMLPSPPTEASNRYKTTISLKKLVWWQWWQWAAAAALAKAVAVTAVAVTAVAAAAAAIVVAEATPTATMVTAAARMGVKRQQSLATGVWKAGGGHVHDCG